MKFRVVLQQDEDGVFVAEVPSFAGCLSQGATRDEALNNVREAIIGYLQSLKQHNELLPPPVDERGEIEARLELMDRASNKLQKQFEVNLRYL
jgi:predicted RNase H-like HicB family nuclease